jgi:hypothetical protein
MAAFKALQDLRATDCLIIDARSPALFVLYPNSKDRSLKFFTSSYIILILITKVNYNTWKSALASKKIRFTE